MRKRLVAASLLSSGLALALLLAVGRPAAPADGSPWDALRVPGAVVVVRHSYAPGGFDPPGARLDDCSTQRNLDESGRAQARRIGAAFRERGIMVGAVLSSPRCRCLDTARLAFEKVEAWEPLQGALDDAARRKRQVAEIRQRVAAHRAGSPLVLVTHGSVVTDLTGRNIRMGELVVLTPAPAGGHAVAAQLYVD